jgi:hypothetical protein
MKIKATLLLFSFTLACQTSKHPKEPTPPPHIMARELGNQENNSTSAMQIATRISQIFGAALTAGNKIGIPTDKLLSPLKSYYDIALSTTKLVSEKRLPTPQELLNLGINISNTRASSMLTLPPNISVPLGVINGLYTAYNFTNNTILPNYYHAVPYQYQYSVKEFAEEKTADVALVCYLSGQNFYAPEALEKISFINQTTLDQGTVILKGRWVHDKGEYSFATLEDPIALLATCVDYLMQNSNFYRTSSPKPPIALAVKDMGTTNIYGPYDILFYRVVPVVDPFSGDYQAIGFTKVF